ncbi:T7SS effector LXG polymorphic toxin [Paraliobacillus ryukyuensis]|uniref:T7SS effector LXG polymorphic toxin n=1 Tax=Paraliobacillus ryukyuensis TaxID=200904 RepID=UPI0009A877CC|nr:T7SS effector LXG polymorphic toxin [Paraliobacillus ryukyuensis]
MANKVDITEVIDFSNDLREASADFRSQLNKVQERIEAINEMNSFSGKAAKEAKKYFNELHITILESFKGLFDDLEANLQQHIKIFGSEVDSSESAIIKSTYLQDVKEDINEIFEDLMQQDEKIHDAIQEVSDISSATPPSFSHVYEDKNMTIKKLKEVDEDLTLFTNKGDETDVKAIMNQIETVMTRAKASEGKARFVNFEGASQGSVLGKLKVYNEGKKEEMMEKAREAKDAELKNLNDGAEDILNMAFNDLEKGKINEETYWNVLNGIKKFDKDVSEGKEDIDVSPELIDYIDKNDNNTDDIVDASGKVINDGISVAPLFTAYGLYRKGFEIQKYKTYGKKMIRYRVYNPEVVGIRKPANRNTKIYDKKYVDQQVKKGNKVPIANRVNVRAGAVSGLKTKAGWLGVAIDTGLNVKDNIEDGESAQRIVGDAGVDVGIGAVSLAAAGAVSAIAVGTVGLPVLAGVALGIGASYVISGLAGMEIGGKSVTDHVKDGVQGIANGVKSGVETVAGWFK